MFTPDKANDTVIDECLDGCATVVQKGWDDVDEWDEFVASHPLGTVYHGTGWKKTIESSYPHMTGRLLVIQESHSGKILAGIPVYHVSSRLLGNRLVSAPHATWCDPLVSDEHQLRILLEATRRLGKSLSTNRIEIKCRHVNPEKLPGQWNVRSEWKHHYIPLTVNPTQLWEQLALTSVRQMVKRAEKNGVLITAERGHDAILLFYSALLETRKRLKLPMIPLRHFLNLDKCFPRQSATVYLAKKEDQILGAALILKGNRRWHLELTGEHPSGRASGAMQSLVWVAVQNAIEAVCKEFSFGRTDIENSGLLKYKRGWATLGEDFSVIELGSSAGSSSKGGMAKASAVIRAMNGIVPRPVYKLLGSFLYRHWG